jgi:uncharacterized membrane protein YvbJ
MIRRCPQCGSAGDDMYGFCIKCGYEFPKIEQNRDMCPLCGYQNPDEADFCVKCGTPLLFKNQFENKQNSPNPVIIRTGTMKTPESHDVPKTSRFLICIGYFFTILGSIIGLIIAVYLITRKDPNAKKHGYIQLAILAFYIALIAILYATGSIPPEVITEYKQLLAGNFTAIYR